MKFCNVFFQINVVKVVLDFVNTALSTLLLSSTAKIW